MHRSYLMFPPQRFKLIRDQDVTGVSGEGHIADGVVWPDGSVSMRWRTEVRSVSFYDCLEDVVEIHGHHGATRLEVVDTLARPDAGQDEQ